jgi:hypothetical protein
MLERRPCSIADICDGLGIKPDNAAACIEDLLQQGKIARRTEADREFFVTK